MDGATWLASASPDPATVETEWRRGLGYALVPAGHLWDVIAHDLYRDGEQTFGTVAAEFAAVLHARHPRAPVMAAGWRECVYVLVPRGTAAEWDVPGGRALGIGAWIAMPRPGRRRPRTAGWWVTEPDGSGTLTALPVLRAALEAYPQARPSTG